jgi:hypothetical protein
MDGGFFKGRAQKDGMQNILNDEYLFLNWLNYVTHRIKKKIRNLKYLLILKEIFNFALSFSHKIKANNIVE